MMKKMFENFKDNPRKANTFVKHIKSVIITCNYKYKL